MNFVVMAAAIMGQPFSPYPTKLIMVQCSDEKENVTAFTSPKVEGAMDQARLLPFYFGNFLQVMPATGRVVRMYGPLMQTSYSCCSL